MTAFRHPFVTAFLVAALGAAACSNGTTPVASSAATTTTPAPTTVGITSPTTVTTTRSSPGPTSGPSTTATGKCSDNGNPHVSSSTWTDLIVSKDSSAKNPAGTVPGSFEVRSKDVLRLVFEVDIPNWQGQMDPASVLLYMYPSGGGPGPSTNIYYAGRYPPPNASGAVTVGTEPGITSGSRLLAAPNLPQAGLGRFELQIYSLKAAWSFAVQRCDDSPS